MANTREHVPALRLASLALVLVLGSLASIVPEAEAQGTGSLTVLAGPYYVPGLPAPGSSCGQAAILGRPAGNETQVQTVQIQTQGGQSISQVFFVYDVVADPGTSTAPGLSKALTWIAPQSGGAGWIATVSHGNQAASGPLTFTGTSAGATIPVGTVVKTLNGIEFTTVQSGALVGAVQAEGRVTFTKASNAEGNPTIHAGTRVRTTSGIEFQTTATAVLTGATAEVGVLAVQGGAAGNVAANTVTVLSTPVAGVVSVTNAAPMAGGRDPSAKVSAVAVEPGLDGNVPANTLRILGQPIAGVTNVTNEDPMAGGTALKAGDQRVLTFTAQPGSQLSGGPGAIFTFAFRVPADRGVRGDTDGSIPDQYPIQVKTTSASGATEARFCVRMDTTPPKVLASVTRDTDYDGRLDLLEVTLNEPLAKDSLVHGQFRLQTKGAPKPYSILATSPELDGVPCGFNPENTVDPAKILEKTPESGSTLPCPRRVILRLAPGPSFDTGDRPELSYPATPGEGTLTDLAGNKLLNLAPGAVNTTDGAKPVMVSALAKDGSNRVVVTFSEAVTGSGTAATGQPAPVYMDGPECATACKGSDFTWLDSCLPKPSGVAQCAPPNNTGSNVGPGDCVDDDAQSGTGMPKQVRGLTHNPSGTTAHQVILEMGTGSSQFPDRYPKAWGKPGQGGVPVPAPGANGCTNGQLGAGDTHKTNGDHLQLAIDDRAGACINTLRKVYDFSPCDAKIRDRTGLRAVAYKAPGGDLIVTGVYVVEAEVNIDSFRLTLKFNGPVSSAQGDNIGIQLSDIDVVSADSTGLGPSGISSINHTAGSDQAIITLDRKTRPTDVDDTPARIRVSCAAGHGIKAFGFPGVFVPCGDPDADNKQDVGMVDRTPPAFTNYGTFPAVSTIDADRNGYIDGLKVYFSEPIDDSSFCMGPTTQANPLPPVTCMGDGFVDPKCDRPSTHSILIVDNMPGPYTFDTDLLPDDNQGIIRFPETPGRLQNTGFTPAITTNPCWTSDPAPNNYRTDSPPTAPAPRFVGKDRGIGLFADQYHPIPSLNPPYLQANYMKRVCGEQFGGGTQLYIPYCLPGSDTGSGGGITVKVADGAPPVLWGARTIDTPPTHQFCTIGNEAGCEGNGFIDGYVLVFSEPVNDCSFRANEWKVAGRNVTGMRTNRLLAGYPAQCPPPRFPPQGQGNNEIVLKFEEGPVPDTDAKPELTYTGQGNCGSCGLRDLNGNAMAAFGPLSIVELDDAPPVITCVRGLVGRDEIVVEFSEPVDDGSREGLTRDDFVYANNNERSFEGASGITSEIDVTGQGRKPVDHKPGDRFATVRLNAPLTHADMRDDTLAAQVQSIFEVAPTVATKKPMPTNVHRYCRGVDTVPPGPATNLQVVTGLTTANSVTLSWTAPGNDDAALSPTRETNGNVTGYRLKISKSPITPENFGVATGGDIVALLDTRQDRDAASCLAANGTRIAGCEESCMTEQVKVTGSLRSGQLLIRMNPVSCDLADPEQVQRATFVGLEQDTTYHFAVAAFDNATDKDGNPRPNFGPMVTGATALTKKDTTPPTPPPVIREVLGKGGPILPFRPQEDAAPLFRWYNSTDPESEVTYAYALRHGDGQGAFDYSIDCGAETNRTLLDSFRPASNLRPGLWTFHLAACSAGGVTPTAHYTILVGAAKLDPQRILNANLRVVTSPMRVGDEYIVNWTLPSQTDIDAVAPGAQLEAVDIVALVCDYEGTGTTPCTRILLATVKGNYSQLATGDRAKGLCGQCFSNGYHDLNRTADYEAQGLAEGDHPYYRVEMVFRSEQRQEGGASNVRDFAEPEDRTPKNEPWLGLILTILVILALGALVAWFVIASRKKAAERQAQEEAPAGVDPDTGLPAHDVKCPTCATPFQAVGTLPLQITCPNCGAAGVLQ